MSNSSDDDENILAEAVAAKTDVKVLGRKAREKREEEINKRREIVRLDAQPSAAKTNSRKGMTLLTVPLRTNKIKRPKKRQTLAKHRAVSSSKTPGKSPSVDSDCAKEKCDNEIDRRIPDISHLCNNPNGAHVSNTVRLHGLPVATKRGDIVRFFNGLDLAQIYVLPDTYNARILEWDAQDDNATKWHNVVLERHPHSVRILVQFETAPIASLAAQRSGERFFLGKSSIGINSESTTTSTKRRGAIIAISQIPKNFASYMFENMAIEWRANTPLQDVTSKVETNVHELVPKIMWTAARYELGFTIDPAEQSQWQKNLHYQPLASFHEYYTTDGRSSLQSSAAERYSSLAKIHNQLLRDYDILTTGCPFPSIAICDCSEILKDPSTRLTGNAAQKLLAAGKQIADHLHVMRSMAKNRCVNSAKSVSVLDCLLQEARDASTPST